jgi:hypothetical protein
MPIPPRKEESSKDRRKVDWTAIGVTVDTKQRLEKMKSAFEKMLNQGSQTWDYFIQALLNLGPPTWSFLLTEIVKSIKARNASCPFPRQIS